MQRHALMERAVSGYKVVMVSDERPDPSRRVPDDVDPAVVEAVGKLTEALETTERARGALYDFHQLTGSADEKAGEAVAMLRDAGAGALADAIEEDLIGRNVLEGRWTFQVVEEYDAGYYSCFRSWEQRARDELVAGRRHLYEAGLKEDRRTHGHPGHEAEPQSVDE